MPRERERVAQVPGGGQGSSSWRGGSDSGVSDALFAVVLFLSNINQPEPQPSLQTALD